MLEILVSAVAHGGYSVYNKKKLSSTKEVITNQTNRDYLFQQDQQYNKYII